MKHGGFQLVIHGDPWREPLRNEASRSGKVFVFGFAGGGSSLKKLDEAKRDNFTKILKIFMG